MDEDDLKCLSMPKEDLRASSKKAKDKSNSAALLALREDTDDSSARDSHCSSEKDSGYSDNGSDWQQADAEHRQHNRVSQQSPRADEHGPAPSPGHGRGRVQEDRAETPNPVVIAGSGEVRPFYILKNMLVKQQEMIQDGGDHIQTKLIWGNGGGNTSTSAASHVILLQQPSAITNLPVSDGLHKPQTRKNNGTGRKGNGTYLPILNSYPRIAPHPAKKPPDKESQDSQSQSKRICTEDQRVCNVSTLKGLLEKHLREPRSVACSSEVPGTSVPVGDTGSCAHLSPAAVSSSLGSQTVSGPDPSLALPRQHSHLSSIIAARKGCGLLNSLLNSHHQRFLNTIEILSQSGLLDITMRTRELLRQSNATELEIAQLRQHTRLLCQAASNPNDGPDGDRAWDKVHKAMAQSGRYPSLIDLCREQNFSNNPHSGDSDSDSGAMGVANIVYAAWKQEAPSLPHHTPTFNLKQMQCPVQEHSSVNSSNTIADAEHSEKHREGNREQSEKVTIVPPDSSTGGDVC